MKSNLQIAFKVGIYHSYFKASICSCISLTPGLVTKSLMKRFDCKHNSVTNIFEFYCNCNGAIPVYLNYIKQTTGIDYFDFGINSTDQKFNYFTELPLNWIGQLAFDTQAPGNKFEKGILSLNEKLSEAGDTNNLGILKVHFDDIIKYSKEKAGARFEIRFTTRSTQWQYFVINRSDTQLQNPVIGKAGITFTGPENVTIKTGEQALLFTSGKKLFPLLQDPSQTFSLMSRPVAGSNDDQAAAGNKTIIKTLPCPDPVQFDFADVGGARQVSSPMYVFI